MLNDSELQSAFAKSPAPKVEKEYIDSRITSKKWEKFSDTVTICQITLDNGFSVRGEAACVNVANYNQHIGERVSYDNAFAKLWRLFGFLLAESQYWSEKKAA